MIRAIIAAVLAAVMLTACQSTAVETARVVLDGRAIDRAVSRAEQINDGALARLEDAQALVDSGQVWLDERKARLRRTKCRFPFTALKRYAESSAARRQAVAEDCGLTINSEAVARPLEPPE